jgi:trk system potassium uptake protein TrkA
MQRVAIIGLGNFGYYLGRELFLKGHDVIGLDTNTDSVQRAKDVIGQAVLADGSDKDTLLALGIDRVDLAVITIGTNMLASILAAFHLKEIGVKRIYTKAMSEEHGQILSRVGAHEILFPEKDLAINLARRIDNPNLLEYLPFIEGYSIFEVEAPTAFVGQTLRELDLINQYGVQVIAIRGLESGQPVFIPKGDYAIRQHDVLTLLGPVKVMAKLPK